MCSSLTIAQAPALRPSHPRLDSLSTIVLQATNSRTGLTFFWLFSGFAFSGFQCARTAPIEPGPPGTPLTDVAVSTPHGDEDAAIVGGRPTTAGHSPAEEAGVAAWSPPLPSSIDGPHQELNLDAGRPILYALPHVGDGGSKPLRLVGHLHGMCGAPSYACGKWIGAGSEAGLLVCPTGNARCGDPTIGPPSWEAPTWPELVAMMDQDLDSAIAKVEAKRRAAGGSPAVRREGSILTGYSRGAYAAPVIARRHPGRWPYLVLIEANVPLTAASLQASGVRAVALVGGEQGTEIAGMTKTQADLENVGFPAKLFVMRRTGHLYSDDMEYVMHDALAFVLSHEHSTSWPDGG